MPEYTVAVNKINYSYQFIKVEAKDEKTASKYALDNAGNYEFIDHDCNYKIVGVVKETVQS